MQYNLCIHHSTAQCRLIRWASTHFSRYVLLPLLPLYCLKKLIMPFSLINLKPAQTWLSNTTALTTCRRPPVANTLWQSCCQFYLKGQTPPNYLHPEAQSWQQSQHWSQCFPVAVLSFHSWQKCPIFSEDGEHFAYKWCGMHTSVSSKAWREKYFWVLSPALLL